MNLIHEGKSGVLTAVENVIHVETSDFLITIYSSKQNPPVAIFNVSETIRVYEEKEVKNNG